MLRSLALRNLATISDTSVEFEEGLNILTGETGAGKSILIDGLLLTLGERADRNMVRPGAPSASVEALFITPDGDEFIVRREVRTEGRSRFFINDQLAALEEGRSLFAGLVDLHSQGSTPALLRRSVQTKALDEFGGCSGEAATVSEDCARYTSGLERLDVLRSRVCSQEDRRDILSHELSLIEELDPSAEDYEGLMSERREMKTARESLETLSRVSEAISGDGGMAETVGAFISSLRGRNSDAGVLLELLEQAGIDLSEAGAECGRLLSRMENAPWRLEEIDQRLDRYSELLGRCGGSLENLLRRRNSLLAELENLDSLKEELNVLENGLPLIADGLMKTAKKLSENRTRAARRLEEAVCGELRLLGMPDAVFTVLMKRPPESRSCSIDEVRICPDGLEVPEFHFSANPGMDPGPLSSVASGGEMSRVSLVLKLALSDVTQAPTMIFDEIDSGVGGETANLLAGSLHRVSRTRQVIVVTHLPQIASKADRHISVFKESTGGLPVTGVRHLLGREERVHELSRLLGGGGAAREHAEKMLSSTAPGRESGGASG